MVSGAEKTTYVILKPFAAACLGPTLTHAYLPMIGADAFSLYSWLEGDCAFQRDLGKIHCPLTRVWRALG